MEKYGYIYAIKHNPTGKIYVGKTRHLKTRLNTHFTNLHTGHHVVPDMQADFNNSDKDYTVYVLTEGEFSDKELVKLESVFMCLLNTKDKSTGYNYRERTSDFSIDKCRIIENPYLEKIPLPVSSYPGLSENEKELILKISQLPFELQKQFLHEAQGAVIALDALKNDYPDAFEIINQ